MWTMKVQFNSVHVQVFLQLSEFDSRHFLVSYPPYKCESAVFSISIDSFLSLFLLFIIKKTIKNNE